jgi:putative transposase
MARVPRSESTRNELKQMFAGSRSADRSGLIRQAARLIVEEALEAEAGQELGRDYYAHGAAGRGYRNGYRTGKVKTAEGVIEFAVPQVSDTAQPFRSQIREVIRGRTEELERLAVEMYARGLSVRDIEAAFTDESGRCVLTKTAVSELNERLWADYQAFAGRDLSEFKVLYLFVDGCIWGSRGKRCSPPGASSRVGRRCCWDWHRERRRTRRAAANSCAI